MYVQQQRGLGDKPPPSVNSRLTAGISRLSAVTQGLQARRPAAAPFRIVPPEYERLESPVRTAGSTVNPGVIVVTAWPFVRLSDDQVKATLDKISLPSGGVGPAVVTGLAVISPVVPTSDPVARARALAPVFIATGFVRDPGVDQSVTRGYIWIAASWSQALSSAQVKRGLKEILAAALPTGATIATRPAAGQVGAIQTVLVAADNETDVALEDAAKKSVLATAQGAIAITGALFGNVPVSFATSRARTEISTAANLMTNAATCLQEIPPVLAQIDAMVAQALAQPVESQPVAGATLLGIKKRLLTCKQYLMDGSVRAPTLLQMCVAEANPETSQVAKALRDQIVADASTKLALYAKVPSVARKYAIASLWSRAQKQLDGHLRGLNEQIQGLCSVAHALAQNSSSVEQLVAAIDAAVAKIDYTVSQLQIDWWKRDLMGVPVYYWIGGGTAIVLAGVGLKIRSIRRRRAAAAGVKKNRRRLS